MGVNVSLDTNKVFDDFKKFTPALIAVLIFTGLILFLPENILQKMMLHSIPDYWKLIFGLLFLLSLSLIVAIGGSIIYRKIIAANKANKFVNNKIKLTKHLSSTQKYILMSLLQSADKTIPLDSTSGDTLYLLNNGFIHRPQQIFSLDESDVIELRYVPQPWLMDLYQNNHQFRKMLEGK